MLICSAKENADDTSPVPDVASLLKDNDKHGVLEERTISLIGTTSWTPHSIVVKDGHFYWIKDEKVGPHTTTPPQHHTTTTSSYRPFTPYTV